MSCWPVVAAFKLLQFGLEAAVHLHRVLFVHVNAV